METRLKPADYIFVSRMKYDAGTKVLINAGLEIILVRQNEDGSFSVDWDKNDPEWKWLNKLSSKEIQLFIEDAIKYDKKN